uniref:Uncharacterized protein n=1 Tax=Ditylenchus dipsaci TaxID=166011 RepID=A0A915CK65_9BILA
MVAIFFKAVFFILLATHLVNGTGTSSGSTLHGFAPEGTKLEDTVSVKITLIPSDHREQKCLLVNFEFLKNK